MLVTVCYAQRPRRDCCSNPGRLGLSSSCAGDARRGSEGPLSIRPVMFQCVPLTWVRNRQQLTRDSSCQTGDEETSGGRISERNKRTTVTTRYPHGLHVTNRIWKAERDSASLRFFRGNFFFLSELGFPQIHFFPLLSSTHLPSSSSSLTLAIRSCDSTSLCSISNNYSISKFPLSLTDAAAWVPYFQSTSTDTLVGLSHRGLWA